MVEPSAPNIDRQPLGWVCYHVTESYKECFLGTLQIRKYYSSDQNREMFSRTYVVRKRFEHIYVAIAARSTRVTF